jgi:hypothetical protein
MENNSILENIKATQERLAAIIKEYLPQVHTVVERIEVMDLRLLEEVTFALCRHDRWEIIGYVWKKQTIIS